MNFKWGLFSSNFLIWGHIPPKMSSEHKSLFFGGYPVYMIELYFIFPSPAGPVGVWCRRRWANLATVTGTAGSSSQYCSLLFILIDTIYTYDIWWYIYIKISVAIVDVQPDGRTCSHFRDCCPDYRQYCGHRAHKQGKLYRIIYNCINIYIIHNIYKLYIIYTYDLHRDINDMIYNIDTSIFQGENIGNGGVLMEKNH